MRRLTQGRIRSSRTLEPQNTNAAALSEPLRR